MRKQLPYELYTSYIQEAPPLCRIVNKGMLAHDVIQHVHREISEKTCRKLLIVKETHSSQIRSGCGRFQELGNRRVTFRLRPHPSQYNAPPSQYNGPTYPSCGYVSSLN